MPDVRGKTVLVRSELNAPIDDGVVTGTYRLEKAVPTLQTLAEKGAKVVVIAHLGRNPEDSLAPVHTAFKALLPEMQFVPDLLGEQASDMIAGLQEGDILLLENVRSDAREKENKETFSKALAAYADFYVDDAFGVMHRTHASVVGIPAHIPGYAGKLVEYEVNGLQKALTPESPSLFLLAGAKFETKEALLKTAVERYDQIFIGGALANDFLKAKGHEVGTSLTSSDTGHISSLLKKENILLPRDVRVENAHGVFVKNIDQVQADDKIVDVGPETITELGTYITHAKDIIWNGPFGLFEAGHIKSTEEVAQLVADSDSHSMVGGGDTVSAIRKLGLEEQFTFISTGGGAMLDFLVDGELPGLEALKQSN